MPAKGQDSFSCQPPTFPREVDRAIRLPLSAGGAPSSPSFTDTPRTGEKTMNIHDPNIATPKVTTGPIAGSRKVYATPEAAPDLRVPLREIALDAELGRAAGAGLRHHRPLHRPRREHRRRAGPPRAAHRLGEGARRRRGIRRPADQAGRQRQRQRQAPGARLPAGARSRCAPSPASRSRSSSSRAPASSPRR